MEKNFIEVLIVEDEPGDLRLTQEMLGEPGLYVFKSSHAGTIKEALHKLGKGAFDVILLDMNLPDSTGLDGLEKITSAHPLVPVILLTGRDDENIGLEALKRHAADYLAKGNINPFLLTRAIRYAMERQAAESERRVTIEFLSLVNEHTGTRGLVRAATAFFQKQSGCRAAGIRLKEGGDFPYLECQGFSEKFVKAENSLCSRDAAGELVRECDGSPALDCLCGSVLRGRTDASKPFFTARGTFWTNSTSELLANTPEDDMPASMRNRCNREGYESVALIPISAGKERLGLLQLNDQNKGLFSPEAIALWERLADQLSIALSKLLAEEALAASEQRLKFHFENSPLGVVEWNAAFVVTQWSKEAENIFGWKKEETLGKRIDKLNLIYPDDLPIVEHTMGRLTSGKERMLISSNRNVTKTGAVIECTWHNSVLPDENGLMASVVSLVQDITERKQAEDEREQLLLEVKQRALELNTVFKTLPYLVSLHGPDGKYLRANPALTNLFGFDPTAEKREEIARRVKARFPDGTPLTMRNMPSTGALNGETITNVEYVITDAHGAEHTLLMNALPLQVEGHVYGAVMAQVDITQRKNKEAELQKLNRVLKARNNSDQAMLHADNEQAYLNSICGIIVEGCGYPFVWIGVAEQDEVRSVRPVAQAGFEEGYLDTLNLSWADTPQGRGPTGTAIRTGKPGGCRNMRTDPAFAPWRAGALKRGYASSLVLPLLAAGQAFGALTIYSKKPEDFGEEEVKLLSGLADDLAYGMRTLRLRAANELSEDDVQRLAKIGVWEYDLVSRILTWSKEVYRIFEVDPEKFATSSKAFLHAVHPEDRETVRKAFADSVANRTIFEVTYRLPMKDGRIKYIKEHSEHSYDKEGRPLRSVGTIHDITRQKEAEAELLAAQSELARAKRLSDIGTLAATVAHELRNPLATIGMASANIKRKSRNQELDKHLLNIDKKVFESNQIINNLLFYSRLRPPHNESVEIHEILEEAVRAARQGMKEGVRLSSAIGGLKEVLVEADPVQLKEVINNLLNNAEDAINAGGGKIEVSGGLKDGAVVITIKDSGAGMDDETLAHAFDPFFTTKAKGTGLGLPVCRQIMDFHKGEVTLSCAPGKGTTARVLLPEKRRGGAGRK